jgi:cytidyltransferase-like protein
MYPIAVSGGFDPIHDGHVAMIQDAATYGGVVVILNSDEWLMRKKGFVFMNYEQRATIVQQMKGVVLVIKAEDDDGTVCETLRKLRVFYFANGGDRTNTTTPELELCKELGITPLFGIGGGKVASSSELVKNARTTNRPWGSYTILEEHENYKVKRLEVLPGEKLSLQYHNKRCENWVVVEGSVEVTTGHSKGTLTAPQSVFIPIGCQHRIENNTEKKAILIEVQYGEYLGEDDIVRIDDKYGRTE